VSRLQALVGNIRYRGQQSGVSEAEIETIIRRAQRRNGLNPKPGLYHGDADVRLSREFLLLVNR